MSPENDKQLCEKYPILYRDRNGSIQETCMAWGFSCGDGWLQIIDELSRELEKFNSDGKERVVAAQVKEKFGGLRVYLWTDDLSKEEGLRVDELVSAAEERAGATCESCGKPSENKAVMGWYSTTCNECRSKEDK